MTLPEEVFRAQTTNWATDGWSPLVACLCFFNEVSRFILNWQNTAYPSESEAFQSQRGQPVSLTRTAASGSAMDWLWNRSAAPLTKHPHPDWGVTQLRNKASTCFLSTNVWPCSHMSKSTVMRQTSTSYDPWLQGTALRRLSFRFSKLGQILTEYLCGSFAFMRLPISVESNQIHLFVCLVLNAAVKGSIKVNGVGEQLKLFSELIGLLTNKRCLWSITIEFSTTRSPSVAVQIQRDCCATAVEIAGDLIIQTWQVEVLI